MSGRVVVPSCVRLSPPAEAAPIRSAAPRSCARSTTSGRCRLIAVILRGVTRRRLTNILTRFLAALYIVAGIAETTRAIITGDGGIPFWFGSLVGGGAMILLGAFGFRHRPRLSFGLITAGCLAGVLATMWTLVVPLVAVAVIILALLRTRDELDRIEGEDG